MAINPSSTKTFSIADIIRRAYQLAGLMNVIESTSDPQWAAKTEMAADFVEMLLKNLQASSILERHVQLVDIAVTGSTQTYTVSSSYLGIIGNAMFAEAGSDVQIPVIPAGREEWQAISAKTSVEGKPSRFWFDRYNYQINLWPVPDTNGTLTIQAHRLIADSNVSSYDPELERHWTLWIVYSLAHMLSLANGLPLDRVAMFKALAVEEKTAVDGYSKSSDPTWMYVTHRSRWNR